MSKILKIAISILIIFLIAAPSCDEENRVTEEQEIFDMRKEILEDFSSDYLTEAELFAHEQKAVQLCYDVHDYRKLISDTTLDMEYRKTIGRLLLQSYVPKAVTGVTCDDQADDCEDGQGPVLIGQNIKGYLDNSTEYLVQSVENVKVETPLHRTGENEYSGKLAYTCTTTGPQNQGNSTNSSTVFYVIKDLKVFDNDTIPVWQVKLGGF